MTRVSTVVSGRTAPSAAVAIRATVRLLILASALLAVPAAAWARPQMQGTAWLLGALPQGAFKDKVENNGLGLGGSFGLRVPESPIYLGAELDYAIYGQARYDQFFPGTPVRIRVQTDNSIMEGLLMLRLQSPAGPFRPYLDGLVGINYLVTMTTLSDTWSGQEIASDKNLDDTALAYGAGGGVMFRLSKRDPSSRLRAILLDVRARYLVGGEAQYLDQGTIRVVNNQLLYQLQQSKTDLMTVGAGVTFEF
jgi:hypothetical protein